MAIDFPRAWELARAALGHIHHPRCSYRQSSGALLCDLACPAIADTPEFRCPALHGSGGKVIRDTGHYGKCPGHHENTVTASDSQRAFASTRKNGGKPMDIATIANDLRDHIEQGQAWFTKVLEQHVPALIAEGQKLAGSKIVKALEDLGEIVLPPDTEQAIADLIRTFAAAGSAAAAAAPPAAGSDSQPAPAAEAAPAEAAAAPAAS